MRKKLKKPKLISKTAFFPEEGILAIGDLHLGYIQMLKNQGININFNQLEETKKELEPILKRVKSIYKLKKIILLGDIKHHFEFEKKELRELKDFLRFLEKFIPKKDIILIRGNHDTFMLKGYTLKDFFIQNNLAFLHGHKNFPEVFENKEIEIVSMGHIHPAILIKDKKAIKREKFKCFLIGKFKSKKTLILPSFFPITEGINIDDVGGRNKFGQIIPKERLKEFETFVVGKNKIYSFGKLKENI